MTFTSSPLAVWLARPAWFGWTRGEWLLYALILAAAAALRFVDLGGRAIHHDEAIHAKESYDMLSGKQYVYDPAYHGPLLYFANTLLFWGFGVSDALSRVIPAAFGVAAVAAVVLVRPELGRTGTPLAMAAITTSTSFLYYSRFIRNDIYVAFFTLVLVGAVVRYVGQPRARWIYLAWVALGLSFVTKENTFIHGFALAMVLLAAGGLALAARRQGPDAFAPGRQALTAFRALGRDVDHLVYGALVFVGITVLFYTSFFTHLPGFRDAFTRSIEYWTDVHQSERVNQPWFYYLMFLGVYEPFALFVGAAALTRAGRARNLLPFMLGVWIAATWIVYSAAGEKAPWLVLHLLWPPLFLASWWVGRWFDHPAPRGRRLALGVISGALLGWTFWFALPNTYQRGDVPIDFVVYVQTAPEVPDQAVEVVAQAAQRSGKGANVRVVVDNNYAWPLAWYLRDYDNVSYPKQLTIDDTRTADVVFMSPASADELGVELTEFVGRRMALRAWFPEFAYKAWDAGFFWSFLQDPAARESFAAWLFLRQETPVPIGTYDFVLYVRTDLLTQGPLGPFHP